MEDDEDEELMVDDDEDDEEEDEACVLSIDDSLGISSPWFLSFSLFGFFTFGFGIGSTVSI